MKYLVVLSLLMLNGCATMAAIGFICPAGIGAQYHPKTKVVEFILKGSPAEELSIQLGDTLLNVEELHGMTGWERTVKWSHLGVDKEAKVKLACLDDLADKNKETW